MALGVDRPFQLPDDRQEFDAQRRGCHTPRGRLSRHTPSGLGFVQPCLALSRHAYLGTSFIPEAPQQSQTLQFHCSVRHW